MTITEQLEELSQVKSDIADAITEKGVDTTAADAFGGFAEKIKSIASSGGVEYYVATPTITLANGKSATITLPFEAWIICVVRDYTTSQGINMAYWMNEPAPDYGGLWLYEYRRSGGYTPTGSWVMNYNSSCIYYDRATTITFKSTNDTTNVWNGDFTLIAIKKPE